jgi:hypothetical protein
MIHSQQTQKDRMNLLITDNPEQPAALHCSTGAPERYTHRWRSCADAAADALMPLPRGYMPVQPQIMALVDPQGPGSRAAAAAGMHSRHTLPVRAWIAPHLHHASSNNSIPEYRFRNLETQLQEGDSGRGGASGTVLPEARGLRAGGFSGPSETPYCRKPPAGSGGPSVCGSEAPASRTPETPLREFIQISDVIVARRVYIV